MTNLPFWDIHANRHGFGSYRRGSIVTEQSHFVSLPAYQVMVWKISGKWRPAVRRRRLEPGA
jgi:hypothetical protein